MSFRRAQRLPSGGIGTIVADMERFALLGSASFGFLAVALGAFGAHGLKARFAPLTDGAQRLEWWATAAHYQAIHALALGLVAYLASRSSSTSVNVAAFAFIAGILVFSGSLYVMALSGLRWLGALTPFGGLAFLLGWGAIFVAALTLPARP